MKLTRVASVTVALVIAVGCGEGDVNKDIKPVDKNAPRPTAAGEKVEKKGGGAEKAGKVMD